MSDQTPDGKSRREPASLSIGEHIDAVCDDFERQLVEGSSPRVEDFLGDTLGTASSTLLHELLRVEIEHRRGRGEQPEVEEYLPRFIGYPEVIAEVFREEKERGYVAHFELLSLAGSGAFGLVWKAYDRRLDRTVALKLPRNEPLDLADRKRFRNEARAAGHLGHPNIVRVYDVGEEPFFISCEFIEGVNLKEWLLNRTVDPREAARICEKLANALQYAHEQGVVHRDLKPGNIIIDTSGEPRLTDFGLAKRLAAETTIAKSGQLLGSPSYMSPEQARGDVDQVGPLSDVYSLGVVLYELLTGTPPFAGEIHSVIHQIIETEPVTPRKLNGAIARDLETICLKAMAKDVHHRYASAAKLAEDIHRFLLGEPIQARRPSLLKRWRFWLHRNRITAVTGTISASVAAVLMVAALFMFFKQDDGPNSLSDLNGSKSPLAPRKVILNTVPPGANLVFWPLSNEDGSVLTDRPVRGKSPEPVELIPSDYLVVAYFDETRFHEVNRHVPGDPANVKASQAYRHQYAQIDSDGTVLLSEIDIPPPNVNEGMVRFEGSPSFVVGSAELPEAPPHARRIPAFDLAVRELTVGDYRTAFNGQVPLWLSNPPDPPQDDWPLISLSYDDAVSIAEQLGLRLPTEAEYEFAATDGGTRKYPWGNEVMMMTPWQIGPSGTPEFDRFELQGNTVTGLYSNACEWTSSWFTHYPGSIGITEPGEVRIERVVRGGPWAVVNGQEVKDEDCLRGPRMRVGLRVTSRKPSVGLRLARSVKPRLQPEDFEKILIP